LAAIGDAIAGRREERGVNSVDFAEIVSVTREFIRGKVVPTENLIEENDEVPDDIRQTAKDMGLYGFAIPEEYGGLGLNMEEEVQLVFELGYTAPALRSMFGTNNGIAGHVLLEGGTEEQKKEWLPKLASGELTASFALTETEAGSDPSTLSTSAERDGDTWVLNGSKRYITNAPIADVFMVFARTNPAAKATRGISTFLVPRDTPGLTVGPKDHKMGQFGAWTSEVFFDDVRVDGPALVGGDEGVDNGYATAMRCLAHGRAHMAACCVGLAGRLVDESVSYAQSRMQSGRPIASFQLIQGLIADSVTDHLAGRSLTLEVARAFDAGTDRKLGPSAAKYFCSEMVSRVADRAVQIHGGAGYMRGVAVERFYRDARLFRIFEGTSQIQQIIIARQMLGSAADG
jgi:acyl-CoA dehydrogenase